MYFVQSKFFNSGKIQTRIYLESECFNLDRSNKELEMYDEYWDEFKTFEEAEAFCKEAEAFCKEALTA